MKIYIKQSLKNTNIIPAYGVYAFQNGRERCISRHFTLKNACKKMRTIVGYFQLRDFVTEILKQNGYTKEVGYCDNNDGTWSVVVIIDGIPYVSKDYGYVGMKSVCEDVANTYESGSIFYI